MNQRPNIPIKNIYYMLCYAWDIIPRADDRLKGLETFDQIDNLLAKLLISDIQAVIKRGFHREYVSYQEELSLVRGRIHVNESIKQQSMIRQKLVCSFDEFSDDVPFNQILKTTINALIKSPHVEKHFKKELGTLRHHFVSINEIRLKKQTFRNLKFNRNNMHYKMLMHICEFFYLNQMANDDREAKYFADFLKDHQMSKLYEKFVLNFYKKHLPSTRFSTHAPKIKWDLDGTYDHVGLEFLPEMKTDIVVEDKVYQKQLIIDTKYYARALKTSNFGETKKLISGNLYQMATYLRNSSYSGDVSGMLLYPTTEQELDLEYKISGYVLKVKTLNLSAEWENISERLMGFC